MTRIFITALKILLFLLLFLALAAGLWLLAGHMGWPRWTVALALAAVLSLVFFILFLRRYYYRRREARFIRRVVDQDNEAIRMAPAEEQRNLTALQERWAAAVATLRQSRLRHRGDPLYTLPWFMVFGESGSGKSTAIAHARVHSILTDVGPTPGMASTRNCDWWFFQNAVVLDTAGRYAIPADDKDRKEWETFLGLLGRYRRKEPLNGLILTLPADRLLSGDTDSLTAYGRSVRMRMDQLMRVLGAKFPVYILITKLDQVLGMDTFAQWLPEALRNQAMGQLNPEATRDPEAFLEEAMARLGEKLKALRLHLPTDIGIAGGSAFVFPDEFKALGPAIKAFSEAAFQKNPYQETPFLRGLFLSSARQSGLARSRIFNTMESMKGQSWALPETAKGIFLHDFFEAILPRDRSGFLPLAEYLSWQKATTHLALAAWLLLLLTVTGLASLSYRHIRQAMAPVHAAFEQKPALGKELAQDMLTLGLLQDRIAEMETRLHHPVLSYLGFPQGQQALEGLKQQYTIWFRDFILTPTSIRIQEKFASLKGEEQDKAINPYLEHLVWRVTLLHEREKEIPPDPSVPDGEDPIRILALAFDGKMPETAAFFPDMYRAYVAWEDSPDLIRNERSALQVQAREFLDIRGRNLHWLAAWAHTRPGVSAVTLEDFWIGPGRVKQAVPVSAAFTEKGQKEIRELLRKIALIAPDEKDFEQRSVLFWNWYARELHVQWSDFARHFDLGTAKFLTRNDWLNAEAAMATLDNPYFRLIERMNLEFSAVRTLLSGEEETRLAGELTDMMKAYRARQEQASLGEKIALRLQTLEAQASRMQQAMAVEAFSLYMQQMGTFITDTASMDAAFRFASRHYGHTGQNTETSPLEQALASLQKIRNHLTPGTLRDSLLWDLMEGPLLFMVRLNTQESACALNSLWQSAVVAETRYTPQRELWQALFGEKGTVQNFLEEAARPFLQRDGEGWGAGSWLHVPFPFHPEFLHFLDQGAIRRQQLQPQYTVSIATLPTRVNKGARTEPYQTRLTLQCAEGAQSLNNFNFPESMDFNWKPDTCEDVTLSIFFRETTLTHTWKGPWGFRDFLRDFRSGTRTYAPADFPGQSALLKDLGIQSVQVRYTLQNAAPLILLEDYPPLKIPDQAAQCWAGLGSPSLRYETPENPASSGSNGGQP